MALVLKDRDIILVSNREAAAIYLKKWRRRAVAIAVEAFELVVKEEKRLFGQKSYFYYLERKERLGIPIPVVEADKEDSADNSNIREVDVDFAEVAIEL